MNKDVEVISNEDGDDFICYGTESKRTAIIAIKKCLIDEFGFNPKYNPMPKMSDLTTDALWYDEEDGFLYWGVQREDKNLRYKGYCFRYKAF